MKTHASRLAYTLAITGALLAFSAGCSKSDRDQASTKAKEIYADSKAAISQAWDSAKSYSFEKRDDFTANGKALAAQMEAQASKLRADYSDAKASASRKAAMAELKNAEADYKQKLDALGTATADTWESAKNNAIAAWDKLEASYRKARAD